MFRLACLMLKIQSHDWPRGTTMNVATSTLPELLTYKKGREREREREREKRLSPQPERIFLQAEHENAASSQHRRSLQAGRACLQDLKGHSIRPRNMLLSGHLQKYR